MTVHAVINPVAGGGYASEIYHSVLDELKDFQVTHTLTTGPGDATRIAQDAVANGVDFILCIGGDGTLNEVVQALAHSNAILVPISAGTGSDFVKTLGLTDLESVKNSMKHRSYSEIDLGTVQAGGNTRYFLNVLEIGFGASVMKRVNSRKKVRGGSSFTSSVFALLPSFRPYQLTLASAERNESLRVAEMVVANGRYFGGGMLAAPAAELDDGFLDIHVVEGMGKMRMIMKLRKLRDGSYVKDPSVRSFKTDKLEVQGEAPVEIDGEDYGALPVKIGLEKKSLKVLAPESSTNK